MKNLIIYLLIAASLFGGGVAFAQNQNLPAAGLIPGSPFYFLDRLGETLQEFFTFNPAAKARLQITFAAERVSEIKVILEKKDVEAKGLEIAQSRLQANLAKATVIVNEQKSKGKDVSNLANELDNKFEAPKSALTQTFKEHKSDLRAQERELKNQIRAAHQAGDDTQAEAIAQELGQVKAQLELLKLKEEDIKGDLNEEEDRLEETLEGQEKAEKKITKAEKKKDKLIKEAQSEGIELSSNTFVEFDGLLAQAKAALNAGNFEEAGQLAKQAKQSLEGVEDTIEKLGEEVEAEEEAERAEDKESEELKEGKSKEEENKSEEKLKEAEKKSEERREELGKKSEEHQNKSGKKERQGEDEGDE